MRLAIAGSHDPNIYIRVTVRFRLCPDVCPSSSKDERQFPKLCVCRFESCLGHAGRKDKIRYRTMDNWNGKWINRDHDRLNARVPAPATKLPIERAVMPYNVEVRVIMKADVKARDLHLFAVETTTGKGVTITSADEISRAINVEDLRQIVSELSAFLDSVDRVYHGEDKSPSKAQWPASGGIVDTDE